MKRRNKTLRDGAPPARRSLAEWIRDAESERPPGGRRDAKPVHIYGKMAQRSLQTLGSPASTQSDGQPSTPERVRNQLDLLWADIAFWRLVASSSNDEDRRRLRHHIVSEHGLSLPLFPPGLWKRLVTAKEERSKLYEIFSRQEWRWLRKESTDDSERVECELWVKGLSDLFQEYLRNYTSRLEMTRSMASREFSGEALKGIMFLARRLSTDAKWCFKNKGKIPTEKVKRPRGRPNKPAVFQRVEQLVELRRAQPFLSDMEVVKVFLKKDTEDDTIRKSAIAARELLWFREGVKVGKGVKVPRRK